MIVAAKRMSKVWMDTCGRWYGKHFHRPSARPQAAFNKACASPKFGSKKTPKWGGLG